MSRSPLIDEKLKLLPDAPGCYLMRNQHNEVIYVGKAKVLKNRVRSYFTGAHDGKTLRLVQEIVDFEYVVVTSEVEALVLEINLIKKYHPKYNIKLKDEGSYPFLAITKERHPRIILTRDAKKEYTAIFGPYPNVKDARETLEVLHRMFQFRKCEQLPKKECLYYHIHQCLAPCIQPVEPTDYEPLTTAAQRFLKGDQSDVLADLEAKMYRASEQMEFEQAIEYRELMQAIQRIATQSIVQQSDLDNHDFFGFYYDKGWLSVQVFYMREGKLIERKSHVVPYVDDPLDAVITFIAQFYQSRNNRRPRAIYTSALLDIPTLQAFLGVKILAPKRGKKFQLVELANENAKKHLETQFQLLERNEQRTYGAIEHLGQLLAIPTPTRIEAFDNSNTGDLELVSGMVVYTDGQPNRKEYRRFKIQTVAGQDDYQAMREVVYRRYLRVIRENLALPSLIVIDGGHAHVQVAKEVLASLELTIPIIGLLKDEKHRTSQVLDGRTMEIVELDTHTETFYLLQRIQDEVHRYALEFHQLRRSKAMVQSALDDIQGIGPKRRQQLLSFFGSVAKMREATVDELAKVVPRPLAITIYQQLKEKTE
ncbi:MAG: excinuclease ABC subunit UvrC [Culicoidibacterales bacterium]